MFIVYVLLIGLTAIAFGVQSYCQKGQITSEPIPVRIREHRNPNNSEGQYLR